MKAPASAPGFRARARSGASGRRPRNCSSTPASATPSPIRPATTYEAQAAAYKATVFAAFNDVEDQLSDLRILEQESTVEQTSRRAAQHSFDLSNQRYKGGVTSYLEVLTAEQALLQNQRTVTRPPNPPFRRQRSAWSAPSAAAGM